MQRTLSLCLLIMLSVVCTLSAYLVYSTGKWERERRLAADLLAVCQRQLADALQPRAFQAPAPAHESTDYILWEVHTLEHDPAEPKSDAEVAQLCDAPDNHDLLRLGTILQGYTIWNDAAGRIKLGCRYIHPRDTTP